MLRRLNSVFWAEKKFYMNVWKTQNMYEKIKKIFSSQIGLHFFAAHWSAFNYTVLRLARIDRKINVGYFDSFIEKIRWEEHLYFYKKKDEKRPSLDAPAPRGFDLCRHQWVKYPYHFNSMKFINEKINNQVTLIKIFRFYWF